MVETFTSRIKGSNFEEPRFFLLKKKYGSTRNSNPDACWCHKEGAEGEGGEGIYGTFATIHPVDKIAQNFRIIPFNNLQGKEKRTYLIAVQTGKTSTIRRIAVRDTGIRDQIRAP